MTDSVYRFEQIAEFVQQRLHEVARQKQDPKLDPVYRWEHTLRASNYGKLIAEAEEANVELAVAGCLLHDVAVFDLEDWRDHGRLGAQIIRPFLLELGYSPAETENVCYSVAVHVDGKADFDHPETLEAEVVSDADNVDRFGAYRSVLWCTVGIESYDGLVTTLTERLKTLEDYRQRRVMSTDTGHRLFNEQLDRQIAFFKAHIEESKLTVLPQL